MRDSKTDLIKMSENELVKQYQLLDVQGRPSKIFTAPSNAKNGDPCLVTEFTYVDNVSTIMKGRKDGYDVWDIDFIPDADFTVEVPKDISKTHILLTKENELVKSYQELDGQNRPVRVYTAPVFAKTGHPCLVVEYIYQNPTSSVFLGKKEAYSTWDESWVPDSTFTVSY